MKNTSIDLSKTLPSEILHILDDVVKTTAELNIPIFIIGATVRDIIMNGMYGLKVPRATDDLDFAVAVNDWGSYEKLKKKLIDDLGFRQDDSQEQRLWRNDYKIDIVPYGGLESETGEIAFPPNGDFKMNIAGLSEAYDNSIPLELEKNIIRIASLSGIVLLKFIAFHDRPAERGKDLDDILFIAENYLDAGALDKLYEKENDLLDEDFDYKFTGARVLGRDLASIMALATQNIVLEVIQKLLAQRYDLMDSPGILLYKIQKGIEERSRYEPS